MIVGSVVVEDAIMPLGALAEGLRVASKGLLKVQVMTWTRLNVTYRLTTTEVLGVCR